MGSIDINSGNYQKGWDTDQFNVDIRDITLALIELLPSGGFDPGGFNFDAKVRRQSSSLEDVFYAHVGGVDTLARALLAAADIIEKGEIAAFKAKRYEGWTNSDLGKTMPRWKASPMRPPPVSMRRTMHPESRNTSKTSSTGRSVEAKSRPLRQLTPRPGVWMMASCGENSGNLLRKVNLRGDFRRSGREMSIGYKGFHL